MYGGGVTNKYDYIRKVKERVTHWEGEKGRKRRGGVELIAMWYG